jgi:hypothetical protein
LPYRIEYSDVEDEPEQVVLIRAVGVKMRAQVRIGGAVIEL